MVAEKSITIEMAHRLPDHNGKCRNIHGHSWVISVAVSGKVKQVRAADDGMIIDFAELKKRLCWIDELFDHTFTIADYDPLLRLLKGSSGSDVMCSEFDWGFRFKCAFGWINVLRDKPPTSENMAIIWASMVVGNGLPDGVDIASISVKETATSEVIWLPEED
jgi:6-pyruvoyltetrahydropterin/6-carboxytetrahydropterin synthase